MSKDIKSRIRHITSSFIDVCRTLHNDIYDYSQVEYVNSYTKVKIICPKHGQFDQRPSFHLAGDGCLRCGRERANRVHVLTQSEFADRAMNAHGQKYDYSKVSYVNSDTNVTIICPDHGDFEQRPHNHFNGKGCSKCVSSKGETLIQEILKRNGIEFIAEYRLPEIKDIYFYDFYLPNHNLLIEFHGIQHYEFNKHFHRTYEKFLKQIVADNIKRELAGVWKYNFFCLRYDIMDILSKEELETLLLKYIYRTSKRK